MKENTAGSNTSAAESWSVQVIQDSTDEVIRTIPASSERDAERIQRGVEINMNHEAYSTKIVGPAGN